MCRRCPAPDNQYYVKDGRTGRFVCEECGFAVTEFSAAGLQTGDYIWRLNPDWPEYHSFDELIARLHFGDAIHLPPCRPVSEIASRLLTYAFDRMGDP